MEVGLIISILAITFTIVNFVLARKDKAVKDAKETNLELINYRLDELDKNVQKILDKLDKQDDEVQNKIEKAMKQHIELYHSKEG